MVVPRLLNKISIHSWTYSRRPMVLPSSLDEDSSQWIIIWLHLIIFRNVLLEYIMTDSGIFRNCPSFPMQAAHQSQFDNEILSLSPLMVSLLQIRDFFTKNFPLCTTFSEPNYIHRHRPLTWDVSNYGNLLRKRRKQNRSSSISS